MRLAAASVPADSSRVDFWMQVLATFWNSLQLLISLFSVLVQVVTHRVSTRSPSLPYSSPLNLRRTSHKVVVPEVIDGVVDEFYERDEQAPRMWTKRDETLEENARDLQPILFRVLIQYDGSRSALYLPYLFLDSLAVGVLEEEEEDAREVVRVHVRVAQLVRDRVEQQVPA